VNAFATLFAIVVVVLVTYLGAQFLGALNVAAQTLGG